MHLDLFFDQNSNFASVKSDINRNGSKVKNQEGSKTLKSQTPAT